MLRHDQAGGNDIECCQFCLTDNAHAPGCEWVGLVAALAARGGVMMAAIVHGLERVAGFVASQLVGLAVQALVSWAEGDATPRRPPLPLWYACRHKGYSHKHRGVLTTVADTVKRMPPKPFVGGDPRINRGGRPKKLLTKAISEILTDEDAASIVRVVMEQAKRAISRPCKCSGTVLKARPSPATRTAQPASSPALRTFRPRS